MYWQHVPRRAAHSGSTGGDSPGCSHWELTNARHGATWVRHSSNGEGTGGTYGASAGRRCFFFFWPFLPPLLAWANEVPSRTAANGAPPSIRSEVRRDNPRAV